MNVVRMQARTSTVDGHAGKGGTAVSSATIATVERAADVLMYFAEVDSRDLGVTEIAGGLGMSKAAAHRVLASLRVRGLIELDEQTRRYSLGVAILQLGLTYLDRIDVRRFAHPELVKLSARTNETATLSVRTGRTRIYVDEVLPRREVIMSVAQGIPYPLHAGASSKSFLAFLPAEEIEAYVAQTPLNALTEGTITDVAELNRELKMVRENGWARSVGERKGGAASVAAPIFDHAGQPAAVVSVCGPAERFDAEFEECRDALLVTTETLSRRLGWTPK